MKYRIPIGLLAFSLLAVCGAQAATTHPTATVATAPAVTAAQTAEQHFIWRASKGNAHIYLVGSIHTLNPNDYPLPDVMENDFADSYALVEEVNLTMVDTDTLQQEALRLGRYPADESLQKALPAETYRQLTAVAQNLGLDMDKLDRLRPWLVALTITSAEFRQAAFKPSDGVDNHFADEAQMMDKPVIGLESSRYQLDLLAQLPEKTQIAMLENSLRETVHFDSEVHTLIGTWQKGEAAGLNKIMQRDFADAPDAYQELIVNRNRAWFPGLEKMANSGHQYFVVIGAAHLVGPDGLLKRFEKAGYKIEQL